MVTDGEFRRGSYWSRFVERVEGLEVREARFKFRDEHGHEQDFTAPHVTGRPRRREPLHWTSSSSSPPMRRARPRSPFRRRRRCISGAGDTTPIPASMPIPESFSAISGRSIAAEIAALAEAGCRYVQLDEVALAMLCDPATRAQIAAEAMTLRR